MTVTSRIKGLRNSVIIYTTILLKSEQITSYSWNFLLELNQLIPFYHYILYAIMLEHSSENISLHTPVKTKEIIAKIDNFSHCRFQIVLSLHYLVLEAMLESPLQTYKIAKEHFLLHVLNMWFMGLAA